MNIKFDLLKFENQTNKEISQKNQYFSNYTMPLNVVCYTPDESITWLVKTFLYITLDEGEEVLDKFIPREDIALVFHFKNPPSMLEPEDGVLPWYFIAPIVPKANLMRINHENEALIAICKPTVFSRLLGISLQANSHTFIPLEGTIFQTWWEEMKVLKHVDRYIAYFTKQIQILSHKKYEPDLVDRFYELILEEGIRQPLSTLVKEFPACERTYQRQFKHRLGVNPKTLVRIVRINFLWAKIKNNEFIDYQSLVYDGNYFDQAHFIKDFKTITGETPDIFFKRDLRNVKMMSGKGL